MCLVSSNGSSSYTVCSYFTYYVYDSSIVKSSYTITENLNVHLRTAVLRSHRPSTLLFRPVFLTLTLSRVSLSVPPPAAVTRQLWAWPWAVA